MRFDGDVLTIDLSMTMEEIREFEQFIRPRIEYVETIDVEEGSGLASSALLALLAIAAAGHHRTSTTTETTGRYLQANMPTPRKLIRGVRRIAARTIKPRRR